MINYFLPQLARSSTYFSTLAMFLSRIGKIRQISKCKNSFQKEGFILSMKKLCMRALNQQLSFWFLLKIGFANEIFLNERELRFRCSAWWRNYEPEEGKNKSSKFYHHQQYFQKKIVFLVKIKTLLKIPRIDP